MKPAQAGALTTPLLPESCRAASSARIASRAVWSVVSLAESAAFVAYEASKTALQSALDAILAELAALQLSGSGGVVFATWELVRGSNVVRVKTL